MPYYPTIAEDLKRAKEIVENGKGSSGCAEFRPDHNGECLNCDEWAAEHGGFIAGADIYGAYELLKSFVEVVEKGPRCDCGELLTKQCPSCAVGDWQAAHPECQACCPQGGKA